MPDLSRAILTLACFITIGSLITVFIVRPGTGEFVISVAALIIGLGIAAVAIGLHTLTHRRAAKHRSFRHEEDK